MKKTLKFFSKVLPVTTIMFLLSSYILPVLDFANIVYAEAPTNLGWNTSATYPADPGHRPVEISCGGYTNQNSVAHNWSDVSGATVYQREWMVPGSGTWTTDPTAYAVTNTAFGSFGGGAGIEGTWDTRVRADDGVGGWQEWSNECEITFDATAPIALVTSHSNGDTISGTATIRGTVTDANPHHYWAVVHNSTNALVSGLSVGAGQLGYGVVNYTTSFTDQELFNWDTTQVPDGTYTIKLEARDSANNKDASDSIDWVTVTVDNAPGATTWLAPTAPAFFTRVGDNGTGGINMYFAQSPESDIDHYEYQYRSANLDGTGASSGVVTMTGVVCAAGICHWSPNMGDGRINIHRVRAVDTAGQAGPWSNYTNLSNAAFAAVPTSDFQYDDYVAGTGVFTAANGYTQANGGYGIREQVPPTSSITSPAGGLTNMNPLSITYAASDADTEVKKVELYYSYEGGAYSLYDTDNAVSGSFDFTYPNGNGTYCFYTIAEDVADDLTADAGVGNREAVPADPCELQVIVDLDPPFTTLSSPIDNSYWNDDVNGIYIAGQSTDNLEVESVTISWSPAGANTWTVITTLTNGENDAVFDWNTYWLPAEGVYDFKAEATDSAGNVESTAYAYSVTFDITNPTLTVTTPVHDSLISGTFPVAGTATDNLSGIQDIRVRFRNESDNALVATFWATYNPGTGEWTVDINDGVNIVADGYYRIVVRAQDMAGNTRSVTVRRVTVDNTAPFVEITNPNDGDTVNLTVDVRGTVTDNNPDHYWLVIEDSGGTVVAGPGTVYRYDSFTDESLYSWDTTQVPDGTYTIKLEARDAAGNKDPNLAPVPADPEDPDDSVDWIMVTVDNSGSIAGMKFEDINANGVQDAGEFALSGWTLYIDEDGNNTYDAGEPFDVTEIDGSYLIEGLAPNTTHTVREVMQNGWMQTYPGSVDDYEHEVFVDYAQDVDAIDFGNFELAVIQGRKYTDHDMDGVHDSAAGEPRLNGWTINLYDQTGAVVDSKVTGHTGGIGQYQFENVAPGTYNVCEVMQTGWVQTGPVVGAHPVNFAGAQQNDATAVNGPEGVCWEVVIDQSGEVYDWMKFGNFEYGKVHGMKWSDLNANGVHDAGEPGLGGWTIVAIKIAQPLEFHFATTDGNGDYTIDSLDRGLYMLGEIQHDGWQQTYPQDPSFYVFAVIRSGQEFYSDDFGNTELGLIQGRKFNDVNHNGRFDQEEKDEPGDPNRLDDWTIYLYDSDWQLVTSMQTGDDSTPAGNVGKGQYRFEDLVTGTYYVCEENRAGWEQTRPNDTTGYATPDPSVAEDVADRCFVIELGAGEERVAVQLGNFQLGTVSGYKWEDTNINGTWDEGENGLEGWAITLDGVESATTNTDGYYEIGNVGYGEHEVCEVMQTGWVQSSEPECYTIMIDESGMIVTENDFGNYYDLFPDVAINAAPGTNVSEGTSVTLSPNVIATGNTPYTLVWGGACSGAGGSYVLPSTPGTYTCSLTITDLDGDTDTAWITVTVNANPIVNPGGGTGGNGGSTVYSIAESQQGNEEEQQEEETEGEVLGELTCDQKTKVSGDIYYDENGNNQKDEGEKGAKGVEVVITATIDGETITVTTVTTDENGHWETELCPGNYEAKINKDSLPENTKVDGDDVLGISVGADEEVSNVNFELKEESSGFNWWYCIIPLLILAALVVVYLLSTRRTRR